MILLLSTNTLSPVDEAVPINCHADCAVPSTDGEGRTETDDGEGIGSDGEDEAYDSLSDDEDDTVEGLEGKNLSQFVIKATPIVPNSPTKARTI